MWYNNAGTTFFGFVINHAFDRQTNGRTDIIFIAKPRLHSMQRSKNEIKCDATKKNDNNKPRRLMWGKVGL